MDRFAGLVASNQTLGQDYKAPHILSTLAWNALGKA